MTDKKENSLIALDTIKPQEVFIEGGADKILDAAKKAVLSTEWDISTEAAREAMKKAGRVIVKTRTGLEKLRKEVKDEYKLKIDVIDGEGKKIKDGLLLLEESFLKPLTDFENAEVKRKEAHEAAIASFEVLAMEGDDLQGMLANEGFLKSLAADVDTQEFEKRYNEARAKALMIISGRIATEKQRIADAEKAEADRIEAQKQREAEIAENARKQAEAEAERKRQQDLIISENEKREALKKAEGEKRALVEQAEAERQKLIKEAEDKQKSIDLENARIKEKAEGEKRAKEAREADSEHRKGINNKALDALIEGGIDADIAKEVIKLIASNKVPNTHINY